MDGKNLVENKLTDSHWFIECMERGAKIVVIAPGMARPHQGRLLDSHPAANRRGALAQHHQIDDRQKVVRRSIRQTLHRFSAAGAHGQLEAPARTKCSQLQNHAFSRWTVDKIQGLTAEQHAKLGDYVIWDSKTKALPRSPAMMSAKPWSRQAWIQFWPGPSNQARGRQRVEVATLWTLYQTHLKDYDLDTVVEITKAPKEMIEQLAEDIATMKPVAIHQGEGINHWFHATEMNRASYLPLMLTGNIGQPGAGSHTWAGNYKAALFQGSAWAGPGFKGWVAEDPFHLNLNESAHGKEIHAHAYTKDEEPAYWNHGDLALVVNTPKFGRKNFTGKTHMPTPTKAMIFTNVNLINNAKWAYGMIKNVDPNVEMIVSVDIQMTASIEYADIALPANSWLEFEGLEITASCSNPFLQIWKGGIPPVFDSKDDVTFSPVSPTRSPTSPATSAFARTSLSRPEKRHVYIQRLLDTCTTTAGYKLADIMAGKYSPSGGCLLNFRTYPRIPFYEQVHDSEPFHTDTGRMHAPTCRKPSSTARTSSCTAKDRKRRRICPM